jgi:hypothetical protein
VNGHPVSLYELQERRLQAAEEKATALQNYTAICDELRTKRLDVDTDARAIVALAEYDQAVLRFETARRDHGVALAGELQARERGG